MWSSWHRLWPHLGGKWYPSNYTVLQDSQLIVQFEPRRYTFYAPTIRAYYPNVVLLVNIVGLRKRYPYLERNWDEITILGLECLKENLSDFRCPINACCGSAVIVCSCWCFFFHISLCILPCHWRLLAVGFINLFLRHVFFLSMFESRNIMITLSLFRCIMMITDVRVCWVYYVKIFCCIFTFFWTMIIFVFVECCR